MDVAKAVADIQGNLTQTMAGLENWKKEITDKLGKSLTEETLMAKIKEVETFVEKKTAERKLRFGADSDGGVLDPVKEYKINRGYRSHLNEIARKFITAVMHKDEAAVKQLNTGVGEDGGFLVPDELADMIIAKREQPNHVMTRWTTMPVGSTSGNIPREGADPTMTWTPENSDPSTTAIKFENMAYKLNVLLGRVPMSRQVVADSRFPLADWFSTVMAKAMRKEFQNVFINGSGSGQPVGLRFNLPAIGARAQLGATLAATDIIKVRRDLLEEYRMDAAWKINGAVIAKIELLVDTQGRFLYLDGLAPQAPGTLLGLPVLEIPQIPVTLGAGSDESIIYLGDTSYYIWFDRGEMAVESTTEGNGAFEKHQVIFKMFTRVDGGLSLVDSYKQLTGVK